MRSGVGLVVQNTRILGESGMGLIGKAALIMLNAIYYMARYGETLLSWCVYISEFIIV